MEYLVTGATGFIGTHLTTQLVEAGHEVTALTRDRSRADHLPDSVRVMEGDIVERETMREPMEDVDGVFHLAAWYQLGPGPWNAEKAERINVDGSRNVFELMDELDIPKGVYLSTIGVYGNTGGEYVDESYRSPNSFPTVYQETKWRAHYEVAEPMIENGLPLVITTLGGIYGPGDKAYGGTPRSAVVNYLNGDLPVIPSDFVLPFDHVEDTAANVQRAMQAGQPGEEYIIASEPRNLVDFFEIAEELTGIPAPPAVPGWVFGLMQYGVAGVEMITRPPEGLESELLGFFNSGSMLLDNSKAERELAIEHRSFREGVREYLSWEVEQQDMQSEIGGQLG